VNFDEMLEQVLELLQRQRRVSYRAIKRRFDLDDDFLEDLKEELLFTYRQIADEDGRGLVWLDDAEVVSESAASLPQPVPHTVAHEARSTATAPPLPDAERRQLTVMFCDLVGSTPLSERLDPEDLRDVVRAYQQTCAEVVRRYEGHIAQLLGDALLVYFGWPQAHEDDAQRAVWTGLGMLDAMDTLNVRLEQEKGVHLAIRVGIHTGLVVVGEMGGGGYQEQLALGDTPNVASRIQGLAPPGVVLISADTHRLVRGYFTVEDRGVHTLKGVSAPMHIYGVRGESAVESRFEAATATGLTPLVGRVEEIELLLRRWEQAKEGEGQVVLLAGEAGIGKSRIVQTLRERLADEPHIRLRGQCLPYYTNSAFYPFIAHLERAIACERDAPPAVKLEALEIILAQAGIPLEEVVPLFAALLTIPIDDRYPPLSLSPQRQKDKTIEALIDQVRGLAQQRPVLYIFEDVHWIDPTSLEAVDAMIAHMQDARVLLVMTYRPQFSPAWSGFTHVTTHTLNRLSRQQVTTMVERVTGGKALPQEVLDQIIAKTDGIPLFVEELTKTILESGLLTADGMRYTLTSPLPPLAIPDTLQGSLMARLDRLAPVRETAQIGATIGKEFAYELLAAVSPLSDAMLQEALHQLLQAELVFRRGQPPEATYVFKHALVQDAAYNSLLRSTRRQLHTKIARVMETHFPTLADAEPELLAHHYTEAGLHEHAVPYWERAGQRAAARSANMEAANHFAKALDLLKTLPVTAEHTRQELMLQVALGTPLIATKGYGALEVEKTYARAWELCQQMEETSQFFPALRGVWNCYLLRTELQRAYELGKQLLSLAQSVQDPALLVEAHRALGTTLLQCGEFAASLEHCEQGIALYDPQQHRSLAFIYGADPGLVCQIYAAVDLWYLGYPDQALQRMDATQVQARELSHPFSLAFVLAIAAMLHQLRREGQVAQERAEAAMRLSTEHGIAQWLAWGTILAGWAIAEQGQREEGIAQMRQGCVAWRTTGAELNWPYFRTMLAEAYGKIGQTEEGLAVLAEAQAAVHKSGGRYHGQGVAFPQARDEAELHRVKGELLVQRTAPDEHQAERCFHQALSVARSQQAKSWELRTATSLARLWHSQGKRQDAYDLLAPVYGWFTEGFDTADLQEAKALLKELS
jgi:class 3 adenylate cyclase/predicted ATPase